MGRPSISILIDNDRLCLGEAGDLRHNPYGLPVCGSYPQMCLLQVSKKEEWMKNEWRMNEWILNEWMNFEWMKNE